MTSVSQLQIPRPGEDPRAGDGYDPLDDRDRHGWNAAAHHAPSTSMDADAWIESLARELGVTPPSERERDAILELAAAAARSSERRAAPVACWIVAATGRTAQDAFTLARTLEARSSADEQDADND